MKCFILVDDVLDMEVFWASGIFCGPNIAVVEALEAAYSISPRNGVVGCVRVVIEQVIPVQRHWNYFKI
ncbi:hypothetical protein ACQ1PO_11785, partial [Ornithobacterium rhinotracheale]